MTTFEQRIAAATTAYQDAQAEEAKKAHANQLTADAEKRAADLRARQLDTLAKEFGNKLNAWLDTKPSTHGSTPRMPLYTTVGHGDESRYEFSGVKVRALCLTDKDVQLSVGDDNAIYEGTGAASNKHPRLQSDDSIKTINGGDAAYDLSMMDPESVIELEQNEDFFAALVAQVGTREANQILAKRRDEELAKKRVYERNEALGRAANHQRDQRSKMLVAQDKAASRYDAVNPPAAPSQAFTDHEREIVTATTTEEARKHEHAHHQEQAERALETRLRPLVEDAVKKAGKKYDPSKSADDNTARVPIGGRNWFRHTLRTLKDGAAINAAGEHVPAINAIDKVLKDIAVDYPNYEISWYQSRHTSTPMITARRR